MFLGNRHPFRKGARPYVVDSASGRGLSRKPDMNRSCPKLVGEIASTSREMSTHRFRHFQVVTRSVRRHQHVCYCMGKRFGWENASLKIHQSFGDLFNCASQHLAAHKKALAAVLENMGKDLFETAKPRKVTVTYRSIPFPVPVTACIEKYNLLVEVHKKGDRAHPWAGPCLVVRGLLLHILRRSGRARSRRIFLPIRCDLGRRFRTS